MKRILIFDSDDEAAAELRTAVEALGQHDVIVAPTLREACLVVTQLAQDLAFVPWSEAENASQALLSLQPNLPVVAVDPEGEPEHFPAAIEGVNAVWTLDEIRTNLPDFLTDDAEAEAIEALPKESSAAATMVQAPESLPPPAVGLEGVDEALEAAARQEKIVAVAVTAESELLEHEGSLADHQVQRIASRIGKTWRVNNTALLQFLRLPSRTSDLLLFTKPLDERHLVTLVALPDIDLGKVREIMEQVFWRTSVEAVPRRDREPPESFVTTRALRADPQDAESYALVWKPRRPLPTTLQTALRRALGRIAEANACVLHYLMVEAELIHIVVSCPSERNTAWVANLFKKGAEAEIQEQFGVPARLWNKGYYAAHSEEPLSQAELSLFLDAGPRA